MGGALQSYFPTFIAGDSFCVTIATSSSRNDPAWGYRLRRGVPALPLNRPFGDELMAPTTNSIQRPEDVLSLMVRPTKTCAHALVTLIDAYLAKAP